MKRLILRPFFAAIPGSVYYPEILVLGLQFPYTLAASKALAFKASGLIPYPLRVVKKNVTLIP